jgi:hypothetical protein
MLTRIRGGVVRVLVVIGIAASSLVAVSGPAQAANLGSSIVRGTYIQKGDYLSRRPVNRSYNVELIMQRDGNLVLKEARTNGRICWNAGTAGRGDYAVYQRDGNLVVIDAGRAIYSSGISSGTTTFIDVEGDLYVGFRRIAAC